MLGGERHSHKTPFRMSKSRHPLERPLLLESRYPMRKQRHSQAKGQTIGGRRPAYSLCFGGGRSTVSDPVSGDV